MAFAQNIVDRRRRIHSRACGHGRRVRFRRVAMELPSPSSSRCRAESDTAAHRQRHTIAEPITTISRGWSRGFRDRCPSGDRLRPTEGSADPSSDGDSYGYPPDDTADDQPIADADSLDPTYANADCESVAVSLGCDQTVHRDRSVDES